ncbi:conserved virulence factor C family protein [Oceanobacillus alkalisoli]|uniref:conserved virulence factor C family protein n=1 Tax=Oceanobacillus alkalisoli TaxID=2925113 RepID=UPI001EE3C44B|nr:conserved virulence factor C family protein [Oceanobacillus alkalisoli]
MRIISIEPTPSPHSMKINVSEELPADESYNYKNSDDLTDAPEYVKELFQIDGVKNIYRVVDFIALARTPKVPWEELLPQVREVLGAEENPEDLHMEETSEPTQSFGQINVFVQFFRGIPIQVKLEDGDDEKRFGLPEAFQEAIMKATAVSDSFIFERKWVEQDPRYGKSDEIGKEVVEELIATHDKEKLNQLVELAIEERDASELEKNSDDDVQLEVLDDPDWKVRYAALDKIIEPSLKHLPLLDKALDDAKASVRRLATAYLGMIEEPEVLPSLYKALKDKAVNVRRTAGDCLSDLGFTEAIPEMMKTLDDKSQIVRWRGAMFLYEVGDERAIPALEAKINDPEFEVRMQVQLALERIKGGKEAKGSIWHQMTQAISKKD